MADAAMAGAPALASPKVPLKARVPGEIGIWLFVAGDLLVFAVFFILIAKGQKEQAEVFARSRAKLDVWVGVVNTLLLLSASWFVATGVERCRSGVALASRYFSAAIACGLGFVANKSLEWSGKISHGLSPATNDFFMYFFVFTGIHLLHVLVGIGVLFMLRSVGRSQPLSANQVRAVESGATFWHLVDLLWVVLFALLYLL